MQKGRGPRARASVLAGAGVRAGTGSLSGLSDWGHWLAGWFAACLSDEVNERRLFLWLPVLFGAGVLLYFSADREPALWAPLTVAALGASAALMARRRGTTGGYRVAAAILFLVLGFLAGCLKSARFDAPILERRAIAKVSAYVEAIELRAKGARLLLRPYSIAGVSRNKVPSRIRVTMRWRPNFSAGISILATMRLLPPPRPSEPGGYDFARDAYFKSIGAVGNLVSRPVRAVPPVAATPASYVARLNAWIDRGRNWLTSRIATVIGGAQGAVAAALVTGKRGTIPETANEDLRAAGIYHIVSISGLHMVLAAGLFLWLLRAGLALLPALALTRPIKTWAALFAMIGATAYCFFSGAEVATQRALIMTLVMLGAVVSGRPAISMRNLAIAALLVLALDPNALLGPSFQMSFGAVAAMIAAFERKPGSPGAAEPWGVRLPASGRQRGDRAGDDLGRDLRADPLGRIALVVAAMALTTLVASIATDPYALYHFHRITPYGLLGNMMVLPLVEFVVMPAAMVDVLAAPFGLDAPVWWLMGQGVAWMMEAARRVAGLQGARILLPAFGPGALLLMTLGLLWLTLWQTRLRWFGVLIAALGISLAINVPKPDLLISGQGRIAAYRTASGALEFLNVRANRFGSAQWLASDADPRKPDAPGLAGNGRCDRSGCIGKLRDGRVLSLALSLRALAEDCPRADIVVTPLFAKNLCKGPERVFDREHLAQFGASRVFLEQDGSLRFNSARAPLYDRPWWRAPRDRARRTTAAKNTAKKLPPGTNNAGWVNPE